MAALRTLFRRALGVFSRHRDDVEFAERRREIGIRVALGACAVPGHAATRVDPMVALRDE